MRKQFDDCPLPNKIRRISPFTIFLNYENCFDTLLHLPYRVRRLESVETRKT